MTKWRDHKFADDFDCKLFDLIDAAENSKGADWAEVAHHLQQARHFVRNQMSEADRRASA